MRRGAKNLQLPMPAEQRARRRDHGDLAQDRTAHLVRPSRQPTPVGIREPELAPLVPQEPAFLDQVDDRLPLPALEPAATTDCASPRRMHNVAIRSGDK